MYPTIELTIFDQRNRYSKPDPTLGSIVPLSIRHYAVPDDKELITRYRHARAFDS